MKDYFTILDDLGNELKMELVLTFKLNTNSQQYIIYKEIDNKFPLYVAKVNVTNGLLQLETNFTKKEQLIVSTILKERICNKI